MTEEILEAYHVYIERDTDQTITQLVQKIIVQGRLHVSMTFQKL